MEPSTERYMGGWLIVCILLGCANVYLKYDKQPSAESLAALYEYHLEVKKNAIEQIKLGQSTSIRPDNTSLVNREQAITAIEQDIIDLGGLYRDDLNNLPKKQMDFLINLLIDTFIKGLGIFTLGMLIGWVFLSFRPKKA
ncbi:hypothetical protein D3C75_989300 [compost metagenome]